VASFQKIPSPWTPHFVQDLRKKFRAETNATRGKGLKPKLILPKKYYFENLRLYKNFFHIWGGQERICPRQKYIEKIPQKNIKMFEVLKIFSIRAMKRIYF